MLVLNFAAGSAQLFLAMLVRFLKGCMSVQVYPGDDISQLGGLVKHNDCVVESHVHVWQLPVIWGRVTEGQFAYSKCQERVGGHLYLCCRQQKNRLDFLQ